MAFEFLAVVGHYSAPCPGTYTHNTVPFGGWKPRSPLFVLYKDTKNYKKKKTVCVKCGHFLVCVACCRISITSISDNLSILGSGWASQCLCFGIYTHNTVPARPTKLIIFLNKLVISGIKPNNISSGWALQCTCQGILMHNTVPSGAAPPLY